MNFLVTGLGNIGDEYKNTRHNIGFMVLDAWAQASNISFAAGRYGSTAEISVRGRKLTLLKPSTYINLSGKAVNYWLQQNKIDKQNLLVVVDDLALPLGTIRLRKRGSAGGHNGLKNIDECTGGEDYARLRIGIGHAFNTGGQINYVLGEFSDDETKLLSEVIDRAVECIKCFVTEGPERAMTRFNQNPQAAAANQ